MSKASPAFLAELRAEMEFYERLFGRLVNQVRNEQGLNQEDFGEAVGGKQNRLHRCEPREAV